MTDSLADPVVLAPLKAINDPEIGINIVDLGLVYRAAQTPAGIEVALTMTTPTCPLGEMISDQVRDALRETFPDAATITVDVVWDPPWSPERMSEEARRQLG